MPRVHEKTRAESRPRLRTSLLSAAPLGAGRKRQPVGSGHKAHAQTLLGFQSTYAWYVRTYVCVYRCGTIQKQKKGGPSPEANEAHARTYYSIQGNACERQRRLNGVERKKQIGVQDIHYVHIYRRSRGSLVKGGAKKSRLSPRQKAALSSRLSFDYNVCFQLRPPRTAPAFN